MSQMHEVDMRFGWLALVWLGCGDGDDGDDVDDTVDPIDLAVECQLVASGHGPEGGTALTVDVIADGMEIPWGLGWLPDGSMLVTERAGALSRIDGGAPVEIAQVPVGGGGEGGLLGLAIHPEFASNRWVYVYYTAVGPENRVERWVLSEDYSSATLDQPIVEGIPALQYHNGGRIRFGPDGHLYVGTGDAGVPDNSPDPASLAGKILRVTDDGSIPADNPFPGEAAYVIGIRNTQGFDWRADGRLIVTDHGPSGLPPEGGRRDHDELSVASAGDDLGWPGIYACETEAGKVTPSMTWAEALPPGGAAVYTGSSIPGWTGDVLVGVLGFGDDIGHLHRFQIADDGNVTLSEVYLRGPYGRIREVVMGPDDELYITTSNCDGRATCADGDMILRVTGG